MAYCWEVYQKSECGACQFFKTFQSGKYDMNKIKDVIIVDPETDFSPKGKQYE